jgi:hypothetical protein
VYPYREENANTNVLVLHSVAITVINAQKGQSMFFLILILNLGI